jgi:hypothetical protein
MPAHLYLWLAGTGEATLRAVIRPSFGNLLADTITQPWSRRR